MVGTGFFTKTTDIQHSKQISELHFIDVGGELLPAIAVVFLAGLKSAPALSEASLKIIVECFFSCYPQYKLQQPYLTATESMTMLVNTLRTSEMVNCLSRVFQQLAADEIYDRVLPYREVFDNLSKDTDYDFLRQPGALIPNSVMAAALCEFLEITLIYSHMGEGQELRERIRFTHPTKDVHKPEWNIQVKEGKYFPGVRHKTDFAYVGALAITPPKLTEKPKEKTGRVAEILDLIKTDNARLLQIYTQWCQNLLTMVHSEELTSSDLMDLYIEFLPAHSSIIDLTKFFSKLAKSGSQPISTKALKNSEEQRNELLASSLASWISTNQIEVDSLFERLESQSRTAPAGL